ncbi:MAG: cardiolipin synthase [Deltaproteobacteria bacterium]|nr:cardiolipin synthase [Deltaproteobacteria bacterium]
MTETQNTLDVIWPLLLHLSNVVGVLMALLLVSRVLRSPRMPAATVGWLFAIILVPLLGIPLYLTFGERKLKSFIKRKTKIALPCTCETYRHPVHSLLVTLNIPASSKDNRVDFHADGVVAYQQLLTLLQGAEHSIDIAIFALGDDAVGHEVLSRLTGKAAQGVKVRLLLDGVGSFKLPKARLRPLVQSGGEIAWFIPVLHRPLHGKTNLRNHRKIIIVDEQKVWSGGRNLASEYLGPDCSCARWVDLSYCLYGSAVGSYRAIFEADWHFATGASSEEKRVEVAAQIAAGDSWIQVVPSGPDVADDPIYAAILTACYKAKQRISIVTPYYIPDSGVQEALKLAALRGVKVDLILPAQSNHRLADIARNRFLRELAQASVRIWLLPGGMVHAKALVVDRTFAMAGSANLDIRSLFLNCEVMSAFYTKKDIVWLEHWLASLRVRSERYGLKPVSAFTEVLEGLVLLGAYQL